MAVPRSSDPRLPTILLGLTAVTGIVDAVSFLALGHVFTANMTGNVVFLGFAVAGAPGLSIPRSATALLAFFSGGVIGGRMGVWMTGGPSHRWISTTFGIEAALLLAATTAALGYQVESLENSTGLYAIIILTALAMGIRNATVRKLAVPDLTTTVLTLTITGLAAESSLAGGNNAGWPRRLASVLTMFAGAGVGAWLLGHSVSLALAACTFVSSVCAIVALVGPRDDRSPNSA